MERHKEALSIFQEERHSELSGGKRLSHCSRYHLADHENLDKRELCYQLSKRIHIRRKKNTASTLGNRNDLSFFELFQHVNATIRTINSK